MLLDERLPRCGILKDANRIRELLQHGRRKRGRHFTVYLSPSERPRAAFLVPKRYGNAVARNIQKRRLRELYRRHRDRLPQGSDVLFLLRTGSHKQLDAGPLPRVGWQELLRDLDGIFPA